MTPPLRIVASLCAAVALAGCATQQPPCFTAHSPSVTFTDRAGNVINIPSQTTRVCPAYVEFEK